MWWGKTHKTVLQAMGASPLSVTSEMPDTGEVNFFGSWISGLQYGDDPVVTV